MRAGQGRRPGLLPVPPALIALGAQAIGRAEEWQRLGGNHVADPGKLLAPDGNPRSTRRRPRRADARRDSGQFRMLSPLLEQHAGRHADAEHVAPAMGKIEQMGIEQRADDVLRRRRRDRPRPQARSPRNTSRCAIHIANSTDGSERAQAGSRRQMSDCADWLTPRPPCRSRPSTIAAELVADRAGAVSDQRRVGDKPDRFPPELQPLARPRRRAVRIEARHLVQHTGDVAPHRRGKRPDQRRCNNGAAQQAEHPSAAEMLAGQQQHQHRNDDQRGPAVRDIGDVARNANASSDNAIARGRRCSRHAFNATGTSRKAAAANSVACAM